MLINYKSAVLLWFMFLCGAEDFFCHGNWILIQYSPLKVIIEMS